MAHPTRGGLQFEPALEEFAKERAGTHLTVLSGGNNSGKSLVLKWLKSTMGKTSYMIGTNRFYHVYHFTSGLRAANELDQFENQFQSNFSSEEYNYEQNYFDLNKIIIGLSDSQREQLFTLCGSLIGCQFALKRVQPDNELSVRYIDVDGQNLSVASTGTRLLMTILGICMDDRFKTLLIDEPELGLSPKVQRALASFLQDNEERQKHFPHLKQVILATHSQLFLNARDLSANYVVSKDEKLIRLTRVGNISDFHRLQFNLLGNSLEGLFLPSAVLYVEGETDQQYLERLIASHLPERNVVVVRTGGDPKKKLAAFRESLGGLQRNPLKSRLFVVLDSTYSRGLPDELAAMGIEPGNVVVWARNGIEYLYPSSIVAAVYGCTERQVEDLTIQGDLVSLNGISLKKAELCAEVLRRYQADTQLPGELVTKLLSPLKSAID